MRKVFNFIFLFFFSSIIFSCNNSSENKEDSKNDTAKIENNTKQDDNVDCSTIGNFLIDSAQAKIYRDNFRSIFKQLGVTDSFWVDKCVIFGLKNFLATTDKNYDGIRIYNAARPKRRINGTMVDSTEIIIVPTSSTSSSRLDDLWAVTVPLSSECSNREFRNINLDYRTQVFSLRRVFEKKHRKEVVDGNYGSAENDSLSRAVWFSSCVIDSLSKYLSDASLNLDGVRLYNAAYNDFIGNVEGQLTANQSTFVMVVTQPGASPRMHTDNWQVLRKIYQANPKFLRGGYNHGTLCPNVCPPTAP